MNRIATQPPHKKEKKVIYRSHLVEIVIITTKLELTPHVYEWRALKPSAYRLRDIPDALVVFVITFLFIQY